MKSIMTRLIVAGLTALPAACATYPGQYYGSSYDYGYYPAQYDSGYGYGVVEHNYYNTYSYPTPAYRIDEYHHHHHDGHDNRRYQDGRRYPPSPGAAYPQRGPSEHGAKQHYNWNAQTAKPYDNHQNDRDHPRRDNRNEGRQRRPDAPDAPGQWQRRQNGERHEAKRQNSGFENRSFDGTNSRRQNNAVPAQQREQPGNQGPRGRGRRDRAGNQSGQ
jgi:hypothetical protein